MKKILFLCISIILIFAVIGCSDRFDSIRYYGVATYYDGESDSLEGLYINIPELGLMIIPDMSVSAMLSNEHISDYTIVAGDLVEFIFKDASNVGVYESYPAGFVINPDFINVYKQDITLSKTCTDSYKLAFPISNLSKTNQAVLDKLEVNAEFAIVKQEIIDKHPTLQPLSQTVVYEFDGQTIGIIVQSDVIDEVLEGLFYGDISLENEGF